MPQQSIELVNKGLSVSQIPDDDKLIFQFITIALEAANSMLEKGNAKTIKEGIDVKKTFLRQLVIFFERYLYMLKFVGKRDLTK